MSPFFPCQEAPVGLKKFQTSIPDALEGLVLKLLAKRRQDRYPSASFLLGELERVTKSHNTKL